MKRGKDEFAEWSELVLDQVPGSFAEQIRRKIASWRDPRARMLRRRRRSKQTTVVGGVGTGVLGGSSVASFMADSVVPLDEFMDTMTNLTGAGLGVAAVPAAIGSVVAWRRYRSLQRTPLPAAAPEPVSLPQSGSAAREPMRKLRDAERSLHESLLRLAEASVDGVSEPAQDARLTAARAATALRQVADRLEAVESAQRFAPQSEQQTLRADVTRLRENLDEGVEDYGKLVAAAARAVAASDRPEQAYLMQDATDRLAGFAEGLHEIAGRERSEWPSPDEQTPHSAGARTEQAAMPRPVEQSAGQQADLAAARDEVDPAVPQSAEAAAPRRRPDALPGATPWSEPQIPRAQPSRHADNERPHHA